MRRRPARSQRHLHAPGLPGPGPGAQAHAEAGAAPAATRQDAVPARHEPQHAGPHVVLENGLPRLPRDGS